MADEIQNTPLVAPVLKLYDKNNIFLTKYDTDNNGEMSLREKRKFNRFWKSNDRINEETAFNTQARKTYMTDFGNYASQVIRNIRAANSQAQSTEATENTDASALDVSDDVTETTTGTTTTGTGTGTGTTTTTTGTRTGTTTSTTGTSTTGTAATTNGTVATTSVDSNTPVVFSINNFANYLNSSDTKIVTKDGKQYLRYDPTGLGDYYVDDQGNIYHSGMFGMLGNQVNHETWSKQQGPEGRVYQQLYNSIINFRKNGNSQQSSDNTSTTPIVQKTAASVNIPTPNQTTQFAYRNQGGTIKLIKRKRI